MGMTEKQYIRLLEDTIEKLDYKVRSITSRNEELEETVKKNDRQLSQIRETRKAGIKAITKRNKEIDLLEKSNRSLVDVIEKKDKEIEYLNGALRAGPRGEQGSGGQDERIKELELIIEYRDGHIQRLNKLIGTMYTSAELKEKVRAAWKRGRDYMNEKLADKQKQNDYLMGVILRL